MSIQEAERLSVARASGIVAELKKRIGQVIFGQDELIDESLCCLFAGGHILMTGAPGLAKTTLVRALANNLGLLFRRVQFTPDLLPSDITGTEILNIDAVSGKRAFEFAKGPLFANLLLADEINRASPKTQSALLEAMQERNVTIGGVTHRLPRPFMVFATQNPYESEGTFPLPEAQLDRFLLHALVTYPSAEAEQSILAAHTRNVLYGESDDAGKTDSAMEEAVFIQVMNAVKNIVIPEPIVAAISQLVRSSRPDDPLCPQSLKPALLYGAGPRAGIFLLSVARAYALLQGSEEVRWRHIRRLARPVMRHRIRLSLAALHDGLDTDSVIDQLLSEIERTVAFSVEA